MRLRLIATAIAVLALGAIGMGPANAAGSSSPAEFGRMANDGYVVQVKRLNRITFAVKVLQGGAAVPLDLTAGLPLVDGPVQARRYSQTGPGSYDDVSVRWIYTPADNTVTITFRNWAQAEGLLAFGAPPVGYPVDCAPSVPGGSATCDGRALGFANPAKLVTPIDALDAVPSYVPATDDSSTGAALESAGRRVGDPTQYLPPLPVPVGPALLNDLARMSSDGYVLQTYLSLDLTRVDVYVIGPDGQKATLDLPSGTNYDGPVRASLYSAGSDGLEAAPISTKWKYLSGSKRLSIYFKGNGGKSGALLISTPVVGYPADCTGIDVPGAASSCDGNAVGFYNPVKSFHPLDALDGAPILVQVP
ncbi:MAG: hypothetical protein ACR2H3_05955 [Acidimicrobiales bacterium]